MRKSFFGIVLVAVSVLALASAAFAQGNPQSPKWGQKLSGKVVEVSGAIEKLDLEAPQTEITIVTNDGDTVEVELGPVWFLEGLNLEIGDLITVSGEWVDEDTIVAYQLKEGETTLTLRSEDGTPLWSGNAEESQPEERNTYRHQSGPQDGSGNQWRNTWQESNQNTNHNQQNNRQRGQNRGR
ncbi:hypothetical protein QBE54_10935 [Thermatribacter velox]|uniref:Magnetosome protein MamS/MamX domain-containing protein n=1 Tax=Thermatribacter velox TaxID=3039681 RepID=A0ABZ2YB74_9BACT